MTVIIFMISILIPVYNCAVIKLVEALHQQLSTCGVLFEILCLDDASESEFSDQNKIIESLTHTQYFVSSINNGRLKSKNILCQKAIYPWLLFLDADVEIYCPNFIKNYLNYIDKDHDFIFGGFAYKNTKPDLNRVLRWKYGRTHEAVSAKKRNKSPYKVTIAANLLVKKDSYLALNIRTFDSNYGMDLLIGATLKKQKCRVLHIENPVFHTGIELNENYIRKKELAATALLKLYHNGEIETSNALLSTFIKLKKIKLNFFFAGLFHMLKTIMMKNLTGLNPNIKLFQFYRISYMCWKDLNP